ncbi:hypothetical protein [Streptomyces sp. NPDC096324]|uniref:hypothetical protein n=1 Tax=Streptomyces sp. NPDC096324 TaxID=3366085 RepID=UPI0037FB1825
MPPLSAEITLATSRTFGLVAIASGEKYQNAEHALKAAGFSRLPNGAFTFPLTDPQATRATASALVHHAHAHCATLTTSSRPYLGDFGSDVAARLPGSWSAELQILSHPLWQEDLWPMLWEAGEIHRALEDHRIPFTCVLKNGADTELLLIERPGHRNDFLLGALTDREQEDPRQDPTTPAGVVLPADPSLAAHAISHTFLSAYRRALHNQDLHIVLDGLERIREEHETLQVIKDSGRYSDGVPLKESRLITGMERDFADHAWLSFLVVLEHAPGLLARCRPAATAWPHDAAALSRLGKVLVDSQGAWNEWNALRRDLYSIPRTLAAHEWSKVRGRLGLTVLPAIETWLAGSEAFERQARAAAPGGPVALSAPSPLQLTSRLTPPPASRTDAAHR